MNQEGIILTLIPAVVALSIYLSIELRNIEEKLEKELSDSHLSGRSTNLMELNLMFIESVHRRWFKTNRIKDHMRLLVVYTPWIDHEEVAQVHCPRFYKWVKRNQKKIGGK